MKMEWECEQGERCSASIYRFCVVFCSISRMPRRHIHFASDFCVFTFSIVFIFRSAHGVCVYVRVCVLLLCGCTFGKIYRTLNRIPFLFCRKWSAPEVRFSSVVVLWLSLRDRRLMKIENGFSFFSNFFWCGKSMIWPRLCSVQNRFLGKFESCRRETNCAHQT